MSEDTHPNAGRASGYTDEQGHAIGENIINRVTELMVGPQTKLVLLADQLDGIVKVQDQRFGYVLNQLSAFLDKDDARHSTYDALLQQGEASTLAALTSVAQRLDQITGYVQQSVTLGRESKEIALRSEKAAMESLAIAKAGATRLKKFQEELEGLRQGQTDYNTRLDAVIARLNIDEDRLDRKRERIDALESEVRELRGPSLSPEQRQRYITILMLMIAEWEAAHPDVAIDPTQKDAL